jgi:hypothetical protein
VTPVVPETRAAVFLVRAWWEEGALRARVTFRVDVVRAEEVVMTTADANELHHLMDTWLNSGAAAADDQE